MGTNGVGSRLSNTQLNNFDPRVGFAYRLNEKTVVRGDRYVPRSILPVAESGPFSGVFSAHNFHLCAAQWSGTAL